MSPETQIIAGIFSVILAVLGYFLYRANHRASVEKTKAEALKAEAESTEIENDIKRDSLPTDEQKKIRYQSVKQEDLQAFIAKFNEQTEQYTNLISVSSELKESCATLEEQLKRSEVLREFFEDKYKKTEANWLETIEELQKCRAERDKFEADANQFGELEKRVTKAEKRVTELEKILCEHKIPFDHIET